MTRRDDVDAAIAPAVAALDAWAAAERVEIGFLLFPRLQIARLAFDELVARVRTADSDRRPVGAPPFALAAFHPEAEPDPRDPERLIPFLRRTPDPCVLVVRMATLERVRSNRTQGTKFIDAAALEASLANEAAEPSLRQRIARANLATAQRVGVDTLRGAIEAIRRDRDATYGALRDAAAALTDRPR